MSDDADLDGLIARAGQAMRDDVGGLSDHAPRTRARVLATRQRSARRGVWAMAATVLLAFGLGVPTVWAWSSGLLADWTGRGDEVGQGDEGALRPAAAEHTTEPQPAYPPTRELPPALERTVTPLGERDVPRDVERGRDVLPDPDVERAGVAAPHAPWVGEALGSTVDPEIAAVDPAERRAYAEAHALHFERRDTSAALLAWDRYLAEYAHGRFALEATYNRALCLVRLGRRDEARQALAPFAEGTHRGYRQRESLQLLEALNE